MSDEPRVQLERNGTVEGEVWVDTDGNVVVEDSNSGETVSVGANGVSASGGVTSPSVQTDELFAEYQPNAGISPHANKIAQAGNEIPLPTFERLDTNPVFTQSEAAWTFEDIMLPIPIEASVFGGDIDDIYVFYSSHETPGMGLATTGHPEDPLTEADASPFLTDILEGGVVYDTNDGELRTYRNTGNSNVELYTSPDGVTWTHQTTVINTMGHAGIPRPFRIGGRYYFTHLYMYNGGGGRRACLSYSRDGRVEPTTIPLHWEGRMKPSGFNQFVGISNTFGAPTYLPYYGGYLVFYQDRQLLDSGISELRMGWTTDGHTISDLGVALDANGPGAQTWEGECIGNAHPFWWDGDLYLFYTGGASDGQVLRDAFGVAKATFDQYRGVN